MKLEPNKLKKIFFTMVLPFLLLLSRPFDMNFEQSILISSLFLVIIWWTTNVVNKIFSSTFLLVIFIVFSSAPLNIIFSFPLSKSFLLIIITYLFSQGIANSELIDKILEPVLIKYANTTIKVLIFAIIMFVITIFVIPQPLARLILVAMLFKNFINKASVSEETKEVLMYACFLIYTVINMSLKRADIILNNASVSFAGLEMSEVEWMIYMTVPVIILGVLVFSLFVFIFRKNLFGSNLNMNNYGFCEPYNVEQSNINLTNQQKNILVIVIVTLILWMTESLHGISSTLVTFVSTVMFFLNKVLDEKDFKAIDITTLVFLTAAFSIGGVLKYSGAADIVFSKVGLMFPREYSITYIFIMIFSSMLLHMILGSNTTTLSVVIPGLIIICKNILPIEIIMFISYLSVSFHSIFPFHALPMMIGASNGYFPSKYVIKMGIPVTFIVYIAVIFIFIPWWRFMGLI